MAEKSVSENSQAKKERFEFVFTVNGNIICQRYFRIHGFKDESLCSNELRESIESCVKLITDDLECKTKIYAWYTSPQVFKNASEMKKWVASPTFKLDVPSYAVNSENSNVFVWDGKEMVPYEGSIAIDEYIGKNNDDTPCVLKFSFNDNGREVASYSWDGNMYPKFVRSNIDLSNSKNKYEADGIHAPMEEFLINKFIADRKDIIPALVRNICVACSYADEKEYTNTLSFKTYDFYRQKEYNTAYNYPATARGAYRKMVKALEAKYRKKTEAYFRGL